jgi:hypothetical protein
MGLGSGKNLFRAPDPGAKKAPDPGSGSETLPDKVGFSEAVCMKAVNNNKKRFL